MTRKPGWLGMVLVSMLALAACNMPGSQASETHSLGSCGDGVCEDPENVTNCPVDCQSGEMPAEAASSEDANVYWVTNPASGARLYMKVLHPQLWSGEALPTLALVPGASNDSSGFLDASQSQAQRIADSGFVVVVFDPDGRGQSEGNEDYDGFVQQDGLAAVIEQVATLPEVDPLAIGLVSYSYGITMAAGALARHADLPVAFLIDWEGPANRDDTGGCDAAHTGHLAGVAECTDEDFWSQREAVTFISQLKVPYQRIQSEKDHFQPDTAHAIAMIDAAVGGGVPFVRLNDLEAGQTFDVSNPPAMLPEENDQQREMLVVKYAQELLMGLENEGDGG
jgi:pimeloyl-ACP methyl ester carboxylesterase